MTKREDFERWCARELTPFVPERRGETYKRYEIAAAWEAWQARDADVAAARSQALEEAAQAVARYRDETSGDTESSLRAQFDSQIDLDVAVFGNEEERRNFICFVMDGRVAILQTCIALIGGWRPGQP